MENYLQQMLKLAKHAMDNAYAVYSQFHVGACIYTGDRQLFAGCNVENVSYGLTQCAEATAIGTMVANGQQKIKEILIVQAKGNPCPPCGACRQRIYEFAAANTLIHLADSSKILKTFTMAEILPEAFGKNNL